RVDDAGVAPLALDVGAVSFLAVSDGLDLALRTSLSRISFLPRGAAAAFSIADRRRVRFPEPVRSFGPPAVRAGDAVAFAAQFRRRTDFGVFRWTAAGGLVPVAFGDIRPVHDPRIARGLGRAPPALGSDRRI